MKNTNITLHTTQKKEYVLTGILSLPLHLGERAWIYSYNQTFATSPVQSILESYFMAYCCDCWYAIYWTYPLFLAWEGGFLTWICFVSQT